MRSELAAFLVVKLGKRATRIEILIENAGGQKVTDAEAIEPGTIDNMHCTEAHANL